MMRPPTPSEPRQPLAGIVERVTFHNPESGFCVLRLKVRGHAGQVTLVGKIAAVSPGEHVQASGTWEISSQHGRQFRATLVETTPPDSLEGMERYLGSGLIKGIGSELANRLVGAFGDKVFDVIEEHPERLKTVDGIGPVRVRRIAESWREQRAVRDIMVFLQSHGMGTSRALRIFKVYGADAVPLVSENPYRLAQDVGGIGFRTADEVAEKLGVPRAAMIRARAGISYTLQEAVSSGHCALPQDDLLTQAEELLEISQATLSEALDGELGEGRVVAGEIEGRRFIFLASLWQSERAIGLQLRQRCAAPPPWPAIDPGRALPWVEGKLGVQLSESQKRAVAQALTSNVLVITGGPGVGKTTLVNAVLCILTAKSVRVALCAPTGRAAKRLAESTGREAKTIHRLLEADPQKGRFRRHQDNPIDCDLLVVDETSMVDVPLMASLLAALPPQAALCLVGDVDQLPSVGPGQVLADTIAAGCVPVARLTEIFRQAAESRIITSAHRVNQGELPDLDAPSAPHTPSASQGRPSDFYFVQVESPEEGARKLLQIVAERIPKRFGLDPLRDVQVLCPMNRGLLGTRTLNLELQSLLNPRRSELPGVERFGWSYRPGDKVMQTENDYDKEVFNGDLGYIESVDPDAQVMMISFDNRSLAYRFGELDQIVLAYATTIHKSQGSEYPAVVITLAMEHYVMLQRNLIYTALTRGRELVVVVGERRAFAKAVRNGGGGERRRWSKLAEWLAPSEEGEALADAAPKPLSARPTRIAGAPRRTVSP